jgi:hypothetical protein
MAFVSSAFERKIIPLRDAEPYLFGIEITVITKYLADAEADPHRFMPDHLPAEMTDVQKLEFSANG